MKDWKPILLGTIVGLLIGFAIVSWTNDIEDRIERLEQVADSTRGVE